MPADVLEASVDLANRRSLLDVDGREILIPTELLFKDFDVIHGDDERVRIHHAPDIAGTNETVDGELVVAVGREIVLDQHAATRAERQTLKVNVLACRG